MKLIISNPRNGLSKTVDITEYTEREVDRTLTVYEAAGFTVRFEK
jgi:hypothetical protein